MTTSENAELNDMIGRIFEELGGRASKDEVLAHVHSSLPDHLVRHLTWTGLSTKIGLFFRKRQDGLPQAPEIDEHGTHAQLELLSPEEYRYIVRKYMEASAANRSQAVRAAERCYETHGVRIDVDNPESWAA